MGARAGWLRKSDRAVAAVTGRAVRSVFGGLVLPAGEPVALRCSQALSTGSRSPEGGDGLNQCDLYVSRMGKIKRRFGDGTGLGKGNRARGVVGDLASEMIDL